MKLYIGFPRNLINGELLRQKKIPCLCKISSEFELVFPDAAPESSGVVTEWDRIELELRAPAGAGGNYTHYARGLITLSEIEFGMYEIIDLEIFYARFGWCPILVGGEYAAPGDFWDQE